MEYIIGAVVVALCIAGLIYCAVRIRKTDPRRKGWGPGPSIDRVMEQGQRELRDAFKSMRKKS